MLKGNYLTATEAGALIGRGANMIAKLCQAGKLNGAEKMGGTWLIPREAVLQYTPGRRGRRTLAERQAADAALLQSALAEAQQAQEK